MCRRNRLLRPLLALELLVAHGAETLALHAVRVRPRAGRDRPTRGAQLSLVTERGR